MSEEFVTKIRLEKGIFSVEQIVPEPITPESLEDALDGEFF